MLATTLPSFSKNLTGRAAFDSWLRITDINDPHIRSIINTIVINEIVGTQYHKSTWEVNGFAPVDTSGTLNLRPCPYCVFGQNGWEVRFKNQLFCD